MRGEVIQGSPTGARLSVRSESFEYIGFSQDRRDQFGTIQGTQLLFLLAMVVLSAVLSLCAWVRHRVMLARGTEEAEPSPEEAAQADQQILVKLSQKLIKKL